MNGPGGQAAPPPVVGFAFMRGHPLRWIALGFGSGLSPWGPGTVGTLFAWGGFVLLDRWIDDTGWAVLIAAAWLIGIWSAHHVTSALGLQDHPAIVWDEVAAFWTVLWVSAPVSGDWTAQLALFLLFRTFDVIKPPPIGWLDRNVKGGIGVMLDDAAAAAATLFAWAVWVAMSRPPA